MKIYNQLTGRVEEVASQADLARVESKLAECLNEAKVQRMIRDALYSKPQMVALIREILADEVEGYQALVAKVEYRNEHLDEFLIKSIAEHIYDKIKAAAEAEANL